MGHLVIRSFSMPPRPPTQLSGAGKSASFPTLGHSVIVTPTFSDLSRIRNPNEQNVSWEVWSFGHLPGPNAPNGHFHCRNGRLQWFLVIILGHWVILVNVSVFLGLKCPSEQMSLGTLGRRVIFDFQSHASVFGHFAFWSF